jgi:hypothetical protein
MKKKIAVLFPGIGYTCDKPLLYYTGKLAVARGYKLVKVEYGNFPSGIKEIKKDGRSFSLWIRAGRKNFAGYLLGRI